MILGIAFVVGRMQGGAFLVGHLVCAPMSSSHAAFIYKTPAHELHLSVQMATPTHWARSLARDTQLA